MRAIGLTVVIWCGAFAANAIDNGTLGSLTFWQDDTLEDISGSTGVRKTGSTQCSTKKDCKKQCRRCKKYRCNSGDCECRKCATSNAALPTDTNYRCVATVTCVCGGKEGLDTDLEVDVIYREDKSEDVTDYVTVKLKNMMSDFPSYKWDPAYYIRILYQYNPELNFVVYDNDDPFVRQLLGETGWIPAQNPDEYFIKLEDLGKECGFGENKQPNRCYETKPKVFFHLQNDKCRSGKTISRLRFMCSPY